VRPRGKKKIQVRKQVNHQKGKNRPFLMRAMAVTKARSLSDNPRNVNPSQSHRKFEEMREVADMPPAPHEFGRGIVESL
jgi:hypothetical protein